MATNDDDVLERVPVSRGQILGGKYRIERSIAIGGMAEIFEATHLDLDQIVALKILLPRRGEPPAATERFLREARIAVRLKSSHVARVLDVGTFEDGLAFIAMERLEGEDLGTLLWDSGPVPPYEAIDYVLQACDAVAEAHALGIIHRDIKPSNLFRTRRRDGVPIIKVLDFGISKMALRSARGEDRGSLTDEHEVIGSPQYMSPEQTRASKHVDARTDIWALGVVLYELLTGKSPFDAESTADIFVQVLKSKPEPLGKLVPGIDDQLPRIVGRCLEQKAEARYPSVRELALDLQALTQVPTSSAMPTSPAWDAPPSTARPVVVAARPPRAHDKVLALTTTRTAIEKPRRWPVLLSVGVALAFVVGLALRRSPNVAASSSPAPNGPALPLDSAGVAELVSTPLARAVDPIASASSGVVTRPPKPRAATSSALSPRPTPTGRYARTDW